MNAGTVSAEEVTRAHLDRIDQHEGPVHAFLHRDAEATLDQARAVDAKRRAGEPLGALAGVPIALKDVLCTRASRPPAPAGCSRTSGRPTTPR